MSEITFDGAPEGYYRETYGNHPWPLPTREEARDFLGAIHEVPWETGSFNRALINAAILADQGNRKKLRREFGGLISAAILYKEHDRGLRMLFDIAGYPPPSYLLCGRRMFKGQMSCDRGLSCAQLGVSPWTSVGCPDAVGMGET
jgi:hypothetical protein